MTMHKNACAMDMQEQNDAMDPAQGGYVQGIYIDKPNESNTLQSHEGGIGIMRNAAITKHMEQMCTGYVTTKLNHGPSTRKGCARDISDKQIN